MLSLCYCKSLHNHPDFALEPRTPKNETPADLARAAGHQEVIPIILFDFFFTFSINVRGEIDW